MIVASVQANALRLNRLRSVSIAPRSSVMCATLIRVAPAVSGSSVKVSDAAVPTSCWYDPVAEWPYAPSLTVTPSVQVRVLAVAFAGAVHVGVRSVASLKAPLLARPVHDAVQAYVSGWPHASLAVTVADTALPDATGFGAPLGPAVIVSVSGTVDTCC